MLYIFLKRQQVVVKLQQQFKEEKTRWEGRRKNNSKCIHRIFEQ